jgi:hypothetical protein
LALPRGQRDAELVAELRAINERLDGSGSSMRSRSSWARRSDGGETYRGDHYDSVTVTDPEVLARAAEWRARKAGFSVDEWRAMRAWATASRMI